MEMKKENSFENNPLSKKSSSFYDYEELKKEAENMRDEKFAEEELKKNLMFEEKDVSLFHIYHHLAEPIDYFYMVLAFIGSIGAGVALPIMSYLCTDIMSEVGNTSEYENDVEMLIERVKHGFNKQIKRFLVIGAIMFVCNFLSICFFSLMGNRMCFRLKRNYFTVILSQEQGWFDSNNAFEFSTKVQAQLEQIEMGIGERFGQIITSVSQCIVSFIFAFIASWKITLIMLVVAPLIIGILLFLVSSLKTGIIMGRRTWEKAGGLAEEMLYNIKTVSSFANFDFETKRFNLKQL